MSTDRSDSPLPGSTSAVGTDQQVDPTDSGREVAGHARSEVEEATEHAAEEVRDLVDTATGEVRDVVDEARDAIRQQADRQAGVAAEALGRIGEDLRAMGRDEAPRAATAEYLDRAARSLDDVVERLEQDGIEGALSGVRRFARRSPGSFLLASAGAGFAVGRLLRNADHPQEAEHPERAASGTGDRGDQGAGPREIDLTDDAPPLSGADVQNRSLVDRGIR